MKVVIAPDSFKGSMRSHEAGEIIATALRKSLPEAELVVIPVADGGEGTTEAVLRATGGKRQEVMVCGPLAEPVRAEFGLLPDGRTAILEMASASGLELVPAGALDPMRTTTFGTGELMAAALEAGATELIVGIGGSATVDGGCGMAQALGYGLHDDEGREIRCGGRGLAALAAIDCTGVHPALAGARVRVASDVTNPLLGAHGAARVFGPQKGANSAMVEELEVGLANLARCWIEAGLLESVMLPGDGAAGGLGAALRAFCRAEMVSGAALVSEITGFAAQIRDAQILITGEGRSDEQTASGKLCSVLAAQAADAGARTILLSGALRGDPTAGDSDFDAAFACVHDVVTLEVALERARESLFQAARSIGRVLALGKELG